MSHHRSVLTFTLFLLTTVGCASAPEVWKAPDVSRAHAIPTLEAAIVYEYYVPDQGTTELHFNSEEEAKAFGRGMAQSVKDDPLGFITSVIDTVEQIENYPQAKAAVESVAPGLAGDVRTMLEGHGFALESDQARADRLVGDGMVGYDYLYVAPRTAPRPFGVFPVWGPGSKASIAERLAKGRAREAYASVRGSLRFDDDDPQQTARCILHVQVVDQDGRLIFEGLALGGGSGASPRSKLEAAHAEAVEKLAAAVVYEG